MTVLRDLNEAAEGVAGQREWIRPVVQQLSAGSAEDSNGPATDAAFNPS